MSKRDSEYLMLTEAARVKGCTPVTIYNNIRAGRLDAISFAQRTLVKLNAKWRRWNPRLEFSPKPRKQKAKAQPDEQVVTQSPEVFILHFKGRADAWTKQLWQLCYRKALLMESMPDRHDASFEAWTQDWNGIREEELAHELRAPDPEVRRVAALQLELNTLRRRVAQGSASTVDLRRKAAIETKLSSPGPEVLRTVMVFQAQTPHEIRTAAIKHVAHHRAPHSRARRRQRGSRKARAPSGDDCDSEPPERWHWRFGLVAALLTLSSFSSAASALVAFAPFVVGGGRHAQAPCH